MQSSSKLPKSKPVTVTALPLLLSEGNSLALTGSSFRFVRRKAAELGLPVLGSAKKKFVNAAAYVAALEREQHGKLGASAEVTADPVETVLQILRNKAGGC